MNDEQLAQLFGTQKIPPLSQAAKTAALNAAMEAFAAQNISAVQAEITQDTSPITAGINATPETTNQKKKTFLTIITSLSRGFSKGSQTAGEHTESRITPIHRLRQRYSLNGPASRFSGWLTVAGLHAGLVIALMVGLTPKNEMVIFDSVKVEAVEDQKELIEPPPPPPPDYVPPPPDFAPPPSFNVAADAPAPVNAITTAPAKAEVARVAAKTPPTPAKVPKKGLSPPSYPSESKKLGEAGVVALALYLTAEGKVQEARVETSSGFPRLDDAAVKHALKTWRFEPCIEDRKPVACWYKIKFRFQLEDAKNGA